MSRSQAFLAQEMGICEVNCFQAQFPPFKRVEGTRVFPFSLKTTRKRDRGRKHSNVRVISKMVGNLRMRLIRSWARK